MDVFCLFLCDRTLPPTIGCNLFNYSNRKLCPILLLSLDVLLICGQHIRPGKFLLKIDLCLQDASLPEVFSAKWNNIQVQWLRAQSISTSWPTCSALHILLAVKNDINVGHSVQMYTVQSVHRGERCLRDSCLRGEFAQCLLFLSPLC